MDARQVLMVRLPATTILWNLTVVGRLRMWKFGTTRFHEFMDIKTEFQILRFFFALVLVQ